MTEELRLEQRKVALKNLLMEMTESLPPIVQTMVQMYRGTVMQYIDAITADQMDALIDKAYALIGQIDCADE